MTTPPLQPPPVIVQQAAPQGFGQSLRQGFGLGAGLFAFIVALLACACLACGAVLFAPVLGLAGLGAVLSGDPTVQAVRTARASPPVGPTQAFVPRATAEPGECRLCVVIKLEGAGYVYRFPGCTQYVNQVDVTRGERRFNTAAEAEAAGAVKAADCP